MLGRACHQNCFRSCRWIFTVHLWWTISGISVYIISAAMLQVVCISRAVVPLLELPPLYKHPLLLLFSLTRWVSCLLIQAPRVSYGNGHGKNIAGEVTACRVAVAGDERASSAPPDSIALTNNLEQYAARHRYVCIFNKIISDLLVPLPFVTQQYDIYDTFQYFCACVRVIRRHLVLGTSRRSI